MPIKSGKMRMYDPNIGAWITREYDPATNKVVTRLDDGSGGTGTIGPPKVGGAVTRSGGGRSGGAPSESDIGQPGDYVAEERKIEDSRRALRASMDAYAFRPGYTVQPPPPNALPRVPAGENPFLYPPVRTPLSPEVEAWAHNIEVQNRAPSHFSVAPGASLPPIGPPKDIYQVMREQGTPIHGSPTAVPWSPPPQPPQQGRLPVLQQNRDPYGNWIGAPELNPRNNWIGTPPAPPENLSFLKRLPGDWLDAMTWPTRKIMEFPPLNSLMRSGANALYGTPTGQ